MLELAETPPVGWDATEGVEIKSIDTGGVPLPDSVVGCRETAPVALDEFVVDASEMVDRDIRGALNALDGKILGEKRLTKSEQLILDQY
jgi:hypothetical protein